MAINILNFVKIQMKEKQSPTTALSPKIVDIFSIIL